MVCDGEAGDIVTVYAVGCGATAPPIQAGVVTPQNSPLALPHEMKIGGVAARLAYAGAIANLIGVYQFNVIIPDAPAGDQPVELIVDGVSNAQGLFISIGR